MINYLIKQWFALKGPHKMQGYSGEQGNWVLLSYHHPDSVVWRWAIYYQPSKEILPSFGPSYSSGKTYFAGKSYFGAWLRLPFKLGVLSISTQPKMLRTRNENRNS